MKHLEYAYEHVCNFRPKKLCMNYRVWVSSGLPWKRKLNSYVEVLQIWCNDWNNFTWPYGVCWDAWNDLKCSWTPSGLAAAYGSKWEMKLMILRLQIVCKGLDSSNMLFMMCLQHWFELKWPLFENSMLTCFGSKNLEKREESV